MNGSVGATRVGQIPSVWSRWFSCLIPTTFTGVLLFLVSAMLVISLIPLYIPPKNLTVSNFQSSLFELRYNTPRSLISEISDGAMVLRNGSLSSDRLKRLQLILQTQMNANSKYKNINIDLSQASIESINTTTEREFIDGKKILSGRRCTKSDNVIIYQTKNNSQDPDQLKILFRFVHRGPLKQQLISSALADIFNRIEFNATTFLELFGELSPLTVPDVSSDVLYYHVKNSQIMEINGVNIFGVKDYNGNIQVVYAIQTNNTIYTLKNGRIVQIQSKDETFVLNYDSPDNKYTVSLISANSSYEIPATYEKPNVTFPTPVFEFSQEDEVPKFFTGVVVELSNQINGRSINDAVLLMTYFDAKLGNISLVMLNAGGGRYYAPIPTNDTIFDKHFNMTKLQITAAQQSDACLQLIKTYSIADICSKVPDVGKVFCAIVSQEMTVTLPDVLRIAFQYISKFTVQPQSYNQVSDFEVTVIVPGEKTVQIMLDSSNQINVTLNSRSTRDVNGINPSDLNTFAVRVDRTRGQCNEQTVAGNDTPDDRIIDVGKSNATIKFSYETYTIKDQIDVYYMNRQIFSTGCVGANGKTFIGLDGNEQTLRVNVRPNCAGETNTAWYYTIECTKELICESDICYCGIDRQKSQQIGVSEPNGCGGEGSEYNFLIQTIGIIWGFTGPCNVHDECYDTCNQLKVACDLQFLNQMQLRCFIFLPVPNLYLSCSLSADAYALAVSIFGTDFFTAAQKKMCQCDTNKRKREINYNNTMLVT